jgi:hypothetical protein
MASGQSAGTGTRLNKRKSGHAQIAVARARIQVDDFARVVAHRLWSGRFSRLFASLQEARECEDSQPMLGF